MTYIFSIDIFLVVQINTSKMTTVTVSPKYQVVIPKEIRERLKLKPGQKLQIFQIGNKLEFIPIRSIKDARGFLKGIDTTIEREKDRI